MSLDVLMLTRETSRPVPTAQIHVQLLQQPIVANTHPTPAAMMRVRNVGTAVGSCHVLVDNTRLYTPGGCIVVSCWTTRQPQHHLQIPWLVDESTRTLIKPP